MRPATPHDLPRLRNLARDALLHDPDAAAIVELLWNGAADGCRIVAEVGDGADQRSGPGGSGHAADSVAADHSPGLGSGHGAETADTAVDTIAAADNAAADHSPVLGSGRAADTADTAAANTTAADHSPILGFALGSLRPARGDQPATGHIDLLVVPATHRGHGIGRALLADLERRLVAAGATRLRIRGNPPNYAWPGIDIRYTPATCLAASAGYERLFDADNMLVDLAAAHRNGLLATDADVTRLAALGVEVRRAEPKDEEELCAWIDATFGGSWAKECSMAVHNEPPTLHVAVRDGAFLGFAAHGAQRAHVFGPMGTDAAARGLGIGAVLLRRCLADQHDAGVAVAEIGWVGPVRFYSRAVGARLGRVFWTFEKAVA